MNIKNQGNEYLALVADIEAPKTVWIAIAVSLAARMHDDDFSMAQERILNEWEALHINQIVPQKPRVRKAGRTQKEQA